MKEIEQKSGKFQDAEVELLVKLVAFVEKNWWHYVKEKQKLFKKKRVQKMNIGMKWNIPQELKTRN